jgi:hypothetical protein
MLAPVAAALEPNEILVVANSDVPDSLDIAWHYCVRRSVPTGHILPLSLGAGLEDTISRAGYEEKIAGPVRKRLAASEPDSGIKAVLLVYGVPFKVGGRGPAKGQQKVLERVQEMRGRAVERLSGTIALLEALAEKDKKNLPKPSKKPSVREMLEGLESQTNKALSRIQALPDGRFKRSCLDRWLRYYTEIYGNKEGLKIREKYADQTGRLSEAESARRLKDLEKRRKLLRVAHWENWSRQKRLKNGYFEAIEYIAGLNNLLSVLGTEIPFLEGRETGASVDSELSLVKFGDYELYRWISNELRRGRGGFKPRTIMVCRLDGPGPGIAKRLVDKAINAEQSRLDRLEGTV